MSCSTTTSTECDCISADSTSQASAFLLVIMTVLIIGICIHLLRSFESAVRLRPHCKVLSSRRPSHLYIGYLVILPPLFVETLCLLYLVLRSSSNEGNGDGEGGGCCCFCDGAPIYFSEAIDWIKHFVFCTLCLLFVHFKLWHCIRLHLQCHDRVQYQYSVAVTAVAVCSLSLMAIQIWWIIPNRESRNVLKYEETTYLVLAAVELVAISIFLECSPSSQGSPATKEREDALYNLRQWKALRTLSITGWSGCCLLYGVWMFAETEYFYLRFGVLSLFAVWIAMWCYIDTKWLLQIVEMEHRTKSPLSNQGIGSGVPFDMDSVLRQIENADSEEVVAATVDVDQSVRRRKREQINICDSESMSDSAPLFMDGGVPKALNSKRNSRKTPRPPPRRKEMKMAQQQDDDEELYDCNIHYGIATDRGSSTNGSPGGDEEIKMKIKGIAEEYSSESTDSEQIYLDHDLDENAVTKILKDKDTTLTTEGEEYPD